MKFIQLACIAIHADTEPQSTIYGSYASAHIYYICRGWPNDSVFMPLLMSLSVCVHVTRRVVCVYFDRFFFWIWTGGSVTAGSPAPYYLSQYPVEHACCPAPPYPSIHPPACELFLHIIWLLIGSLLHFPSFFTAVVFFWKCNISKPLLRFMYFTTFSDCIHNQISFFLLYWHLWSSYTLLRHKPHPLSLFQHFLFFKYSIIYSTAGSGWKDITSYGWTEKKSWCLGQARPIYLFGSWCSVTWGNNAPGYHKYSFTSAKKTA